MLYTMEQMYSKMVTRPFNWSVSYSTSIHFKRYPFLHRLLQFPNSIVRQCIINASSNVNTLIGYKMSYYRSMYGIDTYNAHFNYCLLRAKPLCLMPDQHAQVNSLYELSLAKCNHIIIDGFNPDEITDTIIAIATG